MFFCCLLNETKIYFNNVTCNTVLLIYSKNIMQIFVLDFFFISNIVNKFYFPLPCGYKCKGFLINALYQ